MNPRSAYVHVPFCRHRCGYCNFTLITGRDDLIESYLAAIERELSWIDGRPEIDSLFFGGGTPTHMPVPQLRRLTEIVWGKFSPTDDCEFSVEANPVELTREVVEALFYAGVTRISLGAQSFDTDKLKLLERDHTASDIETAMRLAYKCASSVSIDLVFGAPGESINSWQHDLTRVIELSPDHISIYGLTFEKGTSFWNQLNAGKLRQVDERVELAMYEMAIDQLTAAGYEHYEVSNFAKPGHRSRHNETYWLGKSYYAVGPGAASFVGGVRSTNHRSTVTYLKRILAGESPVAETEKLGSEDAARERLVFGLRRLEGLDATQFVKATGYSIQQLGGEDLSTLTDQGLLQWHGETIKLTRSGLMVSDSIWPCLLRC